MKTNNLFEKLCRMTQKGLKQYVRSILTSKYDKVVTGDGYVYAQGTFPVLLVAHMDTVHKKLPNVIMYDDKFEIVSSPNGIGGDDRCGVYMILEVIKKFKCSVLFCEDEEIGMVGAEKFTKSLISKTVDVNYIIEFDRMGEKDAVFYDCDNPDFEEFITKDFYETSFGSFSDISTLAPYLGCAAVNLSCGYYKAHTVDEYVIIPQMEKSIEEACKILARTTEADKFEYIEATYVYNYSEYYKTKYGYDIDDDDYHYSDLYYMIEYRDNEGKDQWYDVVASSKAEAVGRFLMQFTELTYGNIDFVYADHL